MKTDEVEKMKILPAEPGFKVFFSRNENMHEVTYEECLAVADTIIGWIIDLTYERENYELLWCRPTPLTVSHYEMRGKDNINIIYPNGQIGFYIHGPMDFEDWRKARMEDCSYTGWLKKQEHH